MEDAQKKVSNAIEDFAEDLDKTQIRDLQRNMHLCSARCCEDKTSSLQKVQGCMESCSGQLRGIQSFIEHEMQSFQERLNRCAQSCDDRVRDKAGLEVKESDKPRLQSEMQNCIMKCVDDHVALIPNIKKRTLEYIRKTK